MPAIVAMPAWYSRELLGTPFRANIQNFPFIPTRLLIVMLLDPSAPLTYPIMVTLSAVLAALFTFLYGRRIGIGNLGAAIGGWTFACSGYYASRIAAGHLPLLEAYPALPMLLWMIESQLRDPQHPRRWMLALGAGAACAALAGHPQIPAYSLATAAAYALWRNGLRSTHRAIGPMILGVGCAAFALLPMALIMLQPDLGSALVLAAITMGTLLVAGAKPRHIVILTLLGLVMNRLRDECAAAVSLLAFRSPDKHGRLPHFG
jgi:hypothetical protein